LSTLSEDRKKKDEINKKRGGGNRKKFRRGPRTRKAIPVFKKGKENCAREYVWHLAEEKARTCEKKKTQLGTR